MNHAELGPWSAPIKSRVQKQEQATVSAYSTEMRRSAAFLSLVLITAQVDAAEVGRAVVQEAKRYAHDAKDMALAPIRWKKKEWTRFGAGVAVVAAAYAADEHLYEQVQRHRSSFTDDFAKTITPFGGRRALNISALLILAGSLSHDTRMRDAGRDSLEAEILAGGIVTPLLKRGFGRARPSREEGAQSFHPGSSGYSSFPSGHATNAFAFATAIAGHYDGWVVPTVVYTMASGVAVSRVNDRTHFPSDVVAGALIGRAVARGVVYRHKRGKTATTIIPALIDGRAGFVVRIVWD